jgi:hypothetical protein
MNEQPHAPDTLLTLPVIVGVTVVLGGLSALVVSGFFVYRAHRVNAETERLQSHLQAVLRAEQEPAEHAEATAAGEESFKAEGVRPMAADGGLGSPAGPSDGESAELLETDPAAVLRPGARLQVRRPAHWDQAEIIDVLENQKIRVRWLSGQPGEDVIATELVLGEIPPTP